MRKKKQILKKNNSRPKKKPSLQDQLKGFLNAMSDNLERKQKRELKKIILDIKSIKKKNNQ
jgi:hypothetical protein